MRLAVNLGTWGPDEQALALAEEADRLGYAVCWVAEAYGADAATVLATIAARTERIDIGAGVMQIPARTAAATAMTAASLDQLSGGRFRLGLGVSGPQVSEGWHGVPFAAPLARTREYVDVVRAALRRERLSYSGTHIQLPLPGGPGKALRLAMHPVRSEIPCYLAAVGPANLELAGEIADGWLGIFVAPEFAGDSLARIEAGRQRADRGHESFDVVATAPLVVGNDLDAGLDLVRGYTALYVGGMGSKQQNFYNALVRRMGYEREAETVQDLYLAGQHRAAAEALPRRLLEQTALVGPPERIRDRVAAYAASGVTTLSVLPMAATHDERVAYLRALVDAVEAAGVA